MKFNSIPTSITLVVVIFERRLLETLLLVHSITSVLLLETALLRRY